MRAILNIRLESDEPSDRAIPVVSAFSRTWTFALPHKPLQSGRAARRCSEIRHSRLPHTLLIRSKDVALPPRLHEFLQYGLADKSTPT
jgi:hypothetical protein